MCGRPGLPLVAGPALCPATTRQAWTQDSEAAVGCTTHADAFGCFLAWAPHAVATATVDPVALRIRAFQLTQVDDPRRWTILSSGRDLHDFALKAAIASGAGPDLRRRLKGRYVNTDASFLTSIRGIPFRNICALSSQRITRFCVPMGSKTAGHSCIQALPRCLSSVRAG